MKNLKVGAKIFVGFAAVVLMMAIMSATVLTTTLMINRNAESIRSSSALQTAVNKTLDTLNIARIQANIVYHVANEEANEAFPTYDAQVKELAGEAYIISQSDESLTDYGPDIEAFQTSYEAWSKNVYAVIDANTSLTELGNQGIADAEQVYQTFKAALQARIEAGAPAEQLSVNLTVLDKMAAVRQGLAHIRDTFDNVGTDAIQADIDEVLAIIGDSLAVAADPAVIQSLQDAQAACNSIQDLVDTFITQNDTAWTLMETTRQMGFENAGLLTSLADALDVDMEGDIDATTGLGQTTIWIILAVAAVAIAVAVVMGMIISKLITVPAKGLSFSLNHLATTGRLELPPDVQKLAAEVASRKDELGETAVSYGQLMQRLGYIAGELDKIAEGDLSSTIELASPDDAMGRSLSTMLDKLNNMFGKINTATVQVSNGSKQIADGAQSLAQGSTEQAASVEELSGSIGSVAAKTEENAGMATEAAQLAGTIKTGAERGNQQMAQMMQAVQEITDASQKISNVIKVIDDIAFQTNILALNAAVEAARAGQHGKGFAVVAEEVRNLAGKSAEAAKDTGSMIANSIEKAQLGAQIAQETAASLAEIVDGINQSSQLVGEIATSSNAQSDAIRQINIGIDQVAQVVQQNSATAEESAAASEEMSSQSAILEQLVAQFKLRAGADGYAQSGYGQGGFRQGGYEAAPQLPPAGYNAPYGGSDVIF